MEIILAVVGFLLTAIPFGFWVADKEKEKRKKAKEEWERQNITWQGLEQAVERLYKEIKRKEPLYAPDYIACIGRAGAVVGAMLSHHFTNKTIPIVVMSFDHVDIPTKGGGTKRQDRFIDCCEPTRGLGNVLLLSIDMYTAKTVEKALEELESRDITPKTACVFMGPHANVGPDFYVEADRRASVERLNYPWAKLPWRERPSVPQGH